LHLFSSAVSNSSKGSCVPVSISSKLVSPRKILTSGTFAILLLCSTICLMPSSRSLYSDSIAHGRRTRFGGIPCATAEWYEHMCGFESTHISKCVCNKLTGTFSLLCLRAAQVFEGLTKGSLQSQPHFPSGASANSRIVHGLEEN
jgi:hypothetical protein